MCCGQRNNHRCFCGCTGHASHTPRFVTRDQEIAQLEQYLSGLQEEAEAVKAHVAKKKEEN